MFYFFNLVLCCIILLWCLIQHFMLQYSINHWLIDWSAAISVRPHNLATGFRPPSATVVSAEPFLHGTGTLRCLQKEMATYIVESCALTKLNGGLSQVHSADEDAVSWLTSYGSWHAYEKNITAIHYRQARWRTHVWDRITDGDYGMGWIWEKFELFVQLGWDWG